MNSTGFFLSSFFALVGVYIVADQSAQPFSIIHREQKQNTHELTINIPLAKNDALYHDYLSFSIDQPDVTISSWKPSIEPIDKYDATFRKNKKVYTKPFTIHVIVHTTQQNIENAYLYMTYYLRSQKNIAQHSFPLSLAPVPPTKSVCENNQSEQVPQTVQCPAPKKQAAWPWNISLSTLLATTESWWIRMLLALLLGLLMSLTPCIYPMLPITMGILQSHGSSSVWRNIFLAFIYTMGIATTFALLGTFAAFSGAMFGSIMHNKFVIVAILALLIYLSGSMIGWYNLFIPSFLQKQGASHNGSFLSVFLFGIASGTVASPCLSPGLLLLLTVVTTLSNSLFGFFLLFAFGMGMGIPLLIIGAFSGSLTMLPHAGQWMIDIKQLLGFVMLATSFYFLQPLIAWHIISVLMFLFSITVGVFYLYKAQHAKQRMRFFKNLLGTALVALSVYLLFYAYKTTSEHYFPCTATTLWLGDYKQACEIAYKEHKNVLLEVSAPCCSMCSLLEKNVFSHPTVSAQLCNVVPVRIADMEANECTKTLQKKFKILGAPTVILINPATEKELNRWGCELCDTNVDEFVQQLLCK